MDCPDAVVVYDERFREWGLPVRDGGAGKASSYVVFGHCPWCGIELPRSLRAEWFDAIEALGLADAPRARIPRALRTDAWWRAAPRRYGTGRS